MKFLHFFAADPQDFHESSRLEQQIVANKQSRTLHW